MAGYYVTCIAIPVLADRESVDSIKDLYARAGEQLTKQSEVMSRELHCSI